MFLLPFIPECKPLAVVGMVWSTPVALCRLEIADPMVQGPAEGL